MPRSVAASPEYCLVNGSARTLSIMLQPVINQAVQHAFPVLHRSLLQQTASHSFIARFAARQCHPVPSRAWATAATAQQGPAAPIGVTGTVPSAPSSSGSGKSRAYPDEPRVGVGVVVFRKPVNKAEESPEILLIRRAKEPAKGQWCFPGGSLELGESIAACAVREVLEETGLHIRNNQDADVQGFSSQLQQAIPFAAVDSIVRDEQGQLKFHYVVVEAAAMAADADAVPAASDDVDGVQWMQVAKLRQLENLTKNVARIAEEAVDHFDLSC